MSRHTPGPWMATKFSKGTLGDQDSIKPAGYAITAKEPARFGGTRVAEISNQFDNDEANAARIVACVNACEGINPEAVGDLLELARQAVSGHQQAGYVEPCVIEGFRAAIAKAGEGS